MTAGLVQQYEHSVLPSVYPIHTFLITFISIIVSTHSIDFFNSLMMDK